MKIYDNVGTFCATIPSFTVSRAVYNFGSFSCWIDFIFARSKVLIACLYDEHKVRGCVYI